MFADESVTITIWKNEYNWGSAWYWFLWHSPHKNILREESISIECQTPACRQSSLQIEQIWTCRGRGCGEGRGGGLGPVESLYIVRGWSRGSLYSEVTNGILDIGHMGTPPLTDICHSYVSAGDALGQEQPTTPISSYFAGCSGCVVT